MMSQQQPQGKSVRLLSVVIGTILVFGICVGGWYGIDKFLLEGPRIEREAKACECLRKAGVIAITEPPENHVTAVHFGNPKKITEATYKSLSDLYKVAVINLSGTEINDAQLAYLRGLGELVSLNLTNTRVTDAGLKHLQTIPNLQGLTLNKCVITDAGIDTILGMKRLVILSISDTKVTDQGLRKLVAAQGLVQLFVSGLDITEAGLDEIAKLKNLAVAEIKRVKMDPELIKKRLPQVKVRVDKKKKEEPKDQKVKEPEEK